MAEEDYMHQSLRRWFVPACVLTSLAFFVAPISGPYRAILFTTVNLACLAAIALGVRVHRPERPRGWHLLMLGYLFYSVADVIWFLELPFPSPADFFFLLAYSLLIVGLSAIVRSTGSGRSLGGLLDSLTVTTGMAVLSWVLVVSPYLHASELELSALAVSLAYPFVDVILLGVLVRLSLTSTLAGPAYRLLLLGVAAQLGADNLYAVTLLNGSFDFGHPLLAGYLASFTLIGTAALHPSMRALTVGTTEDEHPSRRERSRKVRIMLLGTSALIPPIVLLAESLRGELENVRVVAGISGALFMLVIARVAGLMSDLSERKRMETELREAESKYRDLIEQLPGVVYTATPGSEGIWTYVSPQLQNLLGFSPQEWMADPRLWLERLHPDDRHRVVAAEDAALLAEAGRANDEYRLVARDGRPVWVRDEATLVTDSDGRPSFFRGVLFDITEHKALEDQLRQSQKMEAVGRLAGGVAHDFNNLLAVVQNYARFIAEDLPEDDPRREDIQEIIKAGERGAQLTRQLLTFSRREVAQPEILDLNAVVADMQKMLSRTIPVTVQLTTRLAPGLWSTKMDPGQVEQILMNLIVNAKDALAGGGRIAIDTANVVVPVSPSAEGLDAGEYVCLTVSDTGGGMTKEVRKRIFEPFFTTKPKDRGTGLGLATVYGIVEQAQGRIFVESQIGAGARFMVYLPRSLEGLPDTAPELSREPSDEGEGKVVLVVEDEEPVRNLVVRILRRSTYTVLGAANGMEAIELADDHAGDIDLLVTDVIMPDVSGPEVAQRTGLPTLFLSGYTDEIVAEQGVLADDKRLLRKPFSAEDLLRAVRSVLATTGRERAASR
ncbi:hypothetical protein BH24ACT26_BH24ACT26_21040 [soil metagenome]